MKKKVKFISQYGYRYDKKLHGETPRDLSIVQPGESIPIEDMVVRHLRGMADLSNSRHEVNLGDQDIDDFAANEIAAMDLVEVGEVQDLHAKKVKTLKDWIDKDKEKKEKPVKDGDDTKRSEVDEKVKEQTKEADKAAVGERSEPNKDAKSS